MKVIAYLAFTLLSIVIQFCVMDLMQDKIKLEDKQVKLNGSGQKKKFEELLKTLTDKPHALYYRTKRNGIFNEKNMTPTTSVNGNMSVQETLASTSSSTVIDEIYDENTSTTEDSFTTEPLYTSTEFDNVTEISIFEKKNRSADKPVLPKKTVNKDCSCNLLYQVCDINCCCDTDCSESQLMLFGGCKDITKKSSHDPHLCYPYQYFSGGEQNNIIDNLFCIVKTNLPEKRNLNQKKYDVTAVSHSYKWKRLNQPKYTEFERKPYVYGEPVWVLKDGSIWYIDTPSPTINSYCSGRKRILFLNNIDVKCVVNIKDLEMLQILKTSKEAPCISVTEKSLNTTALNCSTLHCTNWSIIVCDDIRCVDYNNSIHEPSCTESYCTNIALHIEYIFHFYESKIMNATIILYIQKLTTNVRYYNQNIRVKFILTNESIDKVTEVSGNPGYIPGRPIILSAAESNRSLRFFNTTSTDKKYVSYLSNENGICKVSNKEPNLVLFGLNKRTKCRYVYTKSVKTENSTNSCNEIERSIEQLFGIDGKLYVSPYGNPLEIKDKEWIPVQLNLFKKDITYGDFSAKNSKLRCYNMVTRISYIFTFADVSEVTSKRKNKIVSANITLTTQNITFNLKEVSSVLTTDVNFIDGTKPRMYQYAAGPYINVRLPEDFFFPFRSKGSQVNLYQSVNLISILLCYVM